jgi:hypothetical protein
VGQGFFVTAGTGGNVTFKNNQRIFATESSGSSQFMRSNEKGKKQNTSARINNIDDREKIRLMFDSPKGYHRQVLAGVDQNATQNHDVGYDALLLEDNAEDMYWLINGDKYIIQATDNFNFDQVLPIGVKIDQEGEATFRIQELLNINENKNIILYDKTLNIYHDLKNSNYTVNLSPGIYTDRFELGFSNNNSLGNSEVEYSNIELSYSNDIESIVISNPKNENLKSVKLINILGQLIFTKEINSAESYHEIKIKNLSSGAYILKLEGENGILTKKVSIK